MTPLMIHDDSNRQTGRTSRMFESAIRSLMARMSSGDRPVDGLSIVNVVVAPGPSGIIEALKRIRELSARFGYEVKKEQRRPDQTCVVVSRGESTGEIRLFRSLPVDFNWAAMSVPGGGEFFVDHNVAFGALSKSGMLRAYHMFDQEDRASSTSQSFPSVGQTVVAIDEISEGPNEHSPFMTLCLKGDLLIIRKVLGDESHPFFLAVSHQGVSGSTFSVKRGEVIEADGLGRVVFRKGVARSPCSWKDRASACLDAVKACSRESDWGIYLEIADRRPCRLGDLQNLVGDVVLSEIVIKKEGSKGNG